MERAGVPGRARAGRARGEAGQGQDGAGRGIARHLVAEAALGRVAVRRHHVAKDEAVRRFARLCLRRAARALLAAPASAPASASASASAAYTRAACARQAIVRITLISRHRPARLGARDRRLVKHELGAARFVHAKARVARRVDRVV